MPDTYTPGPWRAHLHQTPKTSRWQLWQDKSASPWWGEYKIADGVSFEEDARLIAAAPDLLAALQFLVADVEAAVDFGCPFEDPDNNFHESVTAARAAIARAIGAVS